MRTFLAGFCAPGGPLAKAVGILLEKQPPPWGPTIPLGISKSYLSKNLQLSGGFLRSWMANISGGDQRFFAPKNLQLGNGVRVCPLEKP